MELKIKRIIKKSKRGFIFFLIIAILTLALIGLFTWSNIKNLSSLNFISWAVIMVFIFIVVVFTAISKSKDKFIDDIIPDVTSFEPTYTNDELKEKARGLKNTSHFKEIENDLNNSNDTLNIIKEVEDNDYGNERTDI